jgi:hypothetical protein
MASTPADDEGRAGTAPAAGEGGRPAHTSSRWSWVALGASLLEWVAAIPTSGLSAFVAPVTLLLTFVAWRRAPHDAVLWVAVALNALLVLVFLTLLGGEATIGRD